MSELPAPAKGTSGEWAPYDYSDGRRECDWKSIYPEEAQIQIKREAWYLVVWTTSYLIFILLLAYDLLWLDKNHHLLLEKGKQLTVNQKTFIGFICAWVGGSLGGFSFGIKWMYHSVAKKIWHQDRRLWRLLTPHLSGVVALFMVLLASSGLLQLFNKDLVTRPVSVLAFGFLVGYFSDKALAKMAEVADTLFGGDQRERPKSEALNPELHVK